MIARVWHGWTSAENADTYETMLRTDVLPGIGRKGIEGYLGAYVLRRASGDEVEFMTLLWFESLEAVREFAGEDYEAAYVPPQARAILARFDARSQHYETVVVPAA